MRFVPQSVLAGFVNALAVLIFLAQMPQLGLNVFHPEKVVVRPDQLPAVWGLMLLTLVIIYGLPRFTKAIPSALIAILVATGLSIGLKLDLPTVASLGTLPTGLPTLAWPDVPFSLDTLGLILPTALAISLVGLMETFLTQDLLDDATDKHLQQEHGGPRPGRRQHCQQPLWGDGRLCPCWSVGDEHQ